jgi:hypothetical protein
MFHVHLDSIANDGQRWRPGDPVYEANHTGPTPQVPVQDHQEHEHQHQGTKHRQAPHCTTCNPETGFSFNYNIWTADVMQVFVS